MVAAVINIIIFQGISRIEHVSQEITVAVSALPPVEVQIAFESIAYGYRHVHVFADIIEICPSIFGYLHPQLPCSVSNPGVSYRGGVFSTTYISNRVFQFD